MAYEPTKSSLQARPLPGWFDDAKLGIFIHWGPQSVPAWAPTAGEYKNLLDERGWRYWFANNPYADWYQNSLKIPGSPTQAYHQRTYGADYPYDNFIPMFEEAARRWDPAAWADVFAQAGARYAVLTTKHHDGYLLWPSTHPNPQKRNYQSRRDLVGELAAAVRARGMRMGLYYSGGLDWTFNGGPIQDLPDLFATIPTAPAYAAYVDAHWRELIARYQPSVLWNDIAYPAGTSTLELFAHYYNAVPDGVVNDRFAQYDLGPAGSARYRAILWGVKTFGPPLIKRAGTSAAPAGPHADFRTPEYASFGKIAARKWETCRGIGYSFCYNRAETDAHMIPVADLVRMFVDIVSKNGNLLLNVGPMPDGTIPEIQLSRLRGLGDWLRINGEAIFGTRPWVRAEGWAENLSPTPSPARGGEPASPFPAREGGQGVRSLPVRFTRRGEVLYAILLGTPDGEQIKLNGVRALAGAAVTLLGGDNLAWSQAGDDLAVTLPARLPDAPAHALRIAPVHT
jgi:alpha-L-fucosidase